jgi:uncharacterized membrane protein YoaT (DUF817 family)
VFAGSFFVVLALSNVLPLEMIGVARYDFILLMALVIQLVLLKTGLETEDEVKTIFLFHLVGFALEVFKVHPMIGSWSYPEGGIFKVMGVPLYSGFMYAAVGSYIAQAWKVFGLKLVDYPKTWKSVVVGVAVYLNFFTHHFVPDFRWWLKLVVIALFWKTKVEFSVRERVYQMPLVLSFVCMGFFIWVAENISTFLGAWEYPDQELSWSIVSFSKVSSWSLLVIISFIIVANLKRYKKSMLK